MKKFLKILLITIFVILVIIIVTPLIFKGKIMDIAKKEINKTVNANVEFSDLGVSLIKNFPYLTVSLKDLNVTGIDEFESDTLISFHSFDISVELISAIKMENIKVKAVILNRPVIYAHVLEDGTANWDIMTESEEEVPDTTITESTLNPKVQLKKFEINNADLMYLDESSGMNASLDELNFRLKGDMSKDFSSLDINADVQRVNFSMDNIRYVRDALFAMTLMIDANLADMIFILKENEISLNDIVLGFDGNFSMPNEEDIVVDMKFNTRKTSFKSILSLIPAIYMRDFEDIKTEGTLKLNGTVSGVYNETNTPSASLQLMVEDAMFSYPDLPGSADNITIDIAMLYDGVQPDNSTIDINRFHVELAGNPVDMTLNINNPVGDMFINANLVSDIELASLHDVVPMEDISLAGRIVTDLDAMGYVSTLENERYEEFKADGAVKITNLVVDGESVPRKVIMEKASLIFSPRFLQVDGLDLIMGQSDMHLNGRVENFIPYVFSDGTLTGEFIFTSGLLNLNEFLIDTEEMPEVEETDTIELSVVEVPGDIDFTLTSRFDQILYDQMDIRNTAGIIKVINSKVILERLKMETLGGTMLMNGEYNTTDINNPFVDFGIQADNIAISQTFNSLLLVREFAPIAAKATGDVSLGMQFTSFMDDKMKPVMNSVVGKGNLRSSSIGINGGNIFQKINSVLNTGTFSDLALGDIDINFEIRNGKLFVDPFKTVMGNTEFLISGEQGLDQTLNYGINVTLPRGVLSKSAINTAFSKASDAGFDIDQSSFLNYDIKVTGTFEDPDVNWDLKNTASQTREVIQQELEEKAREAIEEKKEKAREVVSEEAEKIMQSAEAEAERVRKKAREAAEIIRKEANDNADKLLREAKNPIAKKAAEPVAQKMRQEGEKNAQKLIDEADEKAEKILQEAREKSNKLQE